MISRCQVASVSAFTSRLKLLRLQCLRMAQDMPIHPVVQAANAALTARAEAGRLAALSFAEGVPSRVTALLPRLIVVPPRVGVPRLRRVRAPCPTWTTYRSAALSSFGGLAVMSGASDVWSKGVEVQP